MAEGLIELRESEGVDVASEKGIQYFLDRFYLNRISIRYDCGHVMVQADGGIADIGFIINKLNFRMLQNQHLVVFGSVLPESPTHVGYVTPVVARIK